MAPIFIDAYDLDPIQLTQLFVAYSYILYIGCSMISDGAELLMLTPYSKLVGSVILPILGAVPDGAIVLFSGVGADAQSSLDVGVGALAGSTVMLITIPWFLAIYGGRVNLDAAGVPKYLVQKGKPRLTEGNTWNAGVSTGAEGMKVVRAMSYWMAVTSVPYLVITVGALIAENKHGGITNQATMDDEKAAAEARMESPYAWTGVVMTVCFFCAYLKYQYDRAYSPEPSPAVANRQVRAVTATVEGGCGLVAAVKPLLAAMEKEERGASAPEGAELLAPEHKARGAVMLQKVLRPFFAKYDVDQSNNLDITELGRVFTDLNEPKSAAELELIFKKYDTDKSGVISFPEFCRGMRDFVGAKSETESVAAAASAKRSAAADVEEAKAAPDDDEDDEEEEIPDEFAENKFKSVEEQQAAIKNSAFFLCGVGTIVVLVFSDPIVDVLGAWGDFIGVNAFYVSFVVAPLITNGSELLASYTFALKKTQKSMTIAYEQLLGAAVMNNTYCLFIFLILIAAQSLYWAYTAEVIAILAAELAVFGVATQMPVHTTKTACAVVSIYPLTVLLVWLLETFCGLS